MIGPIVGWLFVAWVAGNFVADVAKNPQMARVQGRYNGTLCRKWCSMSGSFKDGVLRPMAPWPFRRGTFYECPQEGDRDYCTGEVFRLGQWHHSAELLEGSWCAQQQEPVLDTCVDRKAP